MAEAGLEVKQLSFTYPGCKPCIQDCTFDIPRGSRCLLIGANAAGKSTLLQLVAGKYMVAPEAVRVLGRSPFFDMQLTCSGELSYLGASWRKDVAFAGYGVPLQGDISAGQLIYGMEGVDPARRRQLLELLDINPRWRLNRVSDGQRRRVQICVGLLKPYEVLLLDEITVDLDVVGRLDLLEFFRQETEQRGATIFYATHIFDGLEPWITHYVYLEDGQLRTWGVKDNIAELGQGKKLLHVVEDWLEQHHEKQKKARSQRPSQQGDQVSIMPSRTPLMPSKHLAFFR